MCIAVRRAKDLVSRSRPNQPAVRRNLCVLGTHLHSVRIHSIHLKVAADVFLRFPVGEILAKSISLKRYLRRTNNRASMTLFFKGRVSEGDQWGNICYNECSGNALFSTLCVEGALSLILEKDCPYGILFRSPTPARIFGTMGRSSRKNWRIQFGIDFIKYRHSHTPTQWPVTSPTFG